MPIKEFIHDPNCKQLHIFCINLHFRFWTILSHCRSSYFFKHSVDLVIIGGTIPHTIVWWQILLPTKQFFNQTLPFNSSNIKRPQCRQVYCFLCKLTQFVLTSNKKIKQKRLQMLYLPNPKAIYSFVIHVLNNPNLPLCL